MPVLACLAFLRSDGRLMRQHSDVASRAGPKRLAWQLGRRDLPADLPSLKKESRIVQHSIGLGGHGTCDTFQGQVAACLIRR